MNKFDEIIDRRNSSCAKSDSASLYGKSEGLISMWVADMDFRTPDPVREAIVKCADFGIFGYSHTSDSYFEALSNWFDDNFNFPINKEWVVFTPGVVFAIASAIKAFTSEGDSVIINSPVYYPFSNLIRGNGRKLVNSQLVFQNGRYSIDFDDFEKKIVENEVKLYILCSPHNPVGRVWTQDELRTVGDICLRHGVIVISDEIHCDFVWPGHEHTVFASLGRKYAENCIICTAPSKTFNLAGLQTSNIIIPDHSLRKQFRKVVFNAGYSELSTTGAAACEAAYRYGKSWLDELRSYLLGNIEYMKDFTRTQLNGIELIQPEGTYLLWFDCRGLKLEDDSRLDEFITDDAGLWLDAGTMFGAGGEGFQRMNIACPRLVLEKASMQLKTAIEAFQTR